MTADHGYTHRATVVAVAGVAHYVEVPALGIGTRLGPMLSTVPGLAPGDAVLVSQLGTQRDVLAITGRMPGRFPDQEEIPGLTAAIDDLQAADAALESALTAGQAADDARLDILETTTGGHTATLATHTTNLTDHDTRIATIESHVTAPAAFAASVQYTGGAGGEVNIGTGGTKEGWHWRNGHSWTLHYSISWGAPTWNGGYGPIRLPLPSVPSGYSLPARLQMIEAWLYVPASGTAPARNWHGLANYFYTVPGYLYPAFPLSASNASVGGYQIAATAGVADGSIPLTEGGYAEGGWLICEGVLRLASP